MKYLSLLSLIVLSRVWKTSQRRYADRRINPAPRGSPALSRTGENCAFRCWKPLTCPDRAGSDPRAPGSCQDRLRRFPRSLTENPLGSQSSFVSLLPEISVRRVERLPRVKRWFRDDATVASLRPGCAQKRLCQKHSERARPSGQCALAGSVAQRGALVHLGVLGRLSRRTLRLSSRLRKIRSVWLRSRVLVTA